MIHSRSKKSHLPFLFTKPSRSPHLSSHQHQLFQFPPTLQDIFSVSPLVFFESFRLCCLPPRPTHPPGFRAGDPGDFTSQHSSSLTLHFTINMKGFLNKVQRRVSGSGPSDGTGGGNGEKPSTPPVPAKSAAAAAPSGNGARTEATPKADVALPRRERRFVSFQSHSHCTLSIDNSLQKIFFYSCTKDASFKRSCSPL
jgi:hypothetical protein